MKNDSYEPGEYEFHQWLSKYWNGLLREWSKDAGEYVDGQVQTAWEVWQKFWPTTVPDVKRWNVTVGTRYREGKLLEHFDVSTLSSMHPVMVEFSDYAALHRRNQDLEEELKNIKRCMCP